MNKQFPYITTSENEISLTTKFATITDNKEDFNIKDASLFNHEDDLEKAFIKELSNIGYEVSNIHNDEELLKNWRIQLEKLNQKDDPNFYISDSEWLQIQSWMKNKKPLEKTKIIQTYAKIAANEITFDKNKKPINIKLIEKDPRYFHNNLFQVIYQFEQQNKEKGRYDVVILINGLPILQIELKKHNIPINQAFNQITRYKNKVFNDLFEFVQLFVISNQIDTKYFSNTTYENAVMLNSNDSFSLQNKEVNNPWKFTYYWTDIKNHKINNLFSFTKTFLNKVNLFNIIFKYCVLVEEENKQSQLLVMRPYQIAAVEAILNNLIANIANKSNEQGYIWHATGSGKTLTSFKLAYLISQLKKYTQNSDYKTDLIDKIVFVVDRLDLDIQTINKYKSYIVNTSNNILTSKSTNELKRNLNSDKNNQKIIITTIQKLNRSIDDKNVGEIVSENNDELLNKNIVFIFDECHRSLHEEWFKNIKKYFKNSYFYGFTGTPILKEGQIDTKHAANNAKTTKQLFGSILHTYTIFDALEDKSVIECLAYFYLHNNIKNESSEEINDDADVLDKERIEDNCKYIICHYDKLTLSNNKKGFKFNAMLACENIKQARIYYDTLNILLQNDNKTSLRRIAITYSFEENKEETQIQDSSNKNNENLNDKEFLFKAINKLNQSLSFNSDSKSFYDQKDIKEYDSKLAKLLNANLTNSSNNKIENLDLLIVVDKFLTGFDCPILNTIFIDKKNLKDHNLIQTYSRVNRPFELKENGNVINFRNIKQFQDDAYKLYANNNNINEIISIPKKEDLILGIKEIISKIENNFNNLSILNTLSKQEQADFIELYSKYKKLSFQLNNIIDLNLSNEEKEICSFKSNFKDIYEQQYLSLIKKIENNKENNIEECLSSNTEIPYEIIKFEDKIDANYLLQLIKDKISDLEFKKKLELSYQFNTEDKQDILLSFRKFWLNNNHIQNIKELFLDYAKNDFKEKNEIFFKDYNLKYDAIVRLFRQWNKNKKIERKSDWLTKISNKKYSLFSSNAEDEENMIFNKLIEIYDKYKDFEIFMN